MTASNRKRFHSILSAVLAAVAPTVASAVVNESAKLVAGDATAFANFGSVAIDGDTAIVGAPASGLAFPGIPGIGSAYVFVRDGATWSQQAKLVGDDIVGGWFGLSVAVSGDTAVVGAPGELYGPEGYVVGSAYVFVREGTTWSLEARLLPSDVFSVIEFGWAVAIAGDTVVVSTPTSGITGAAYVFERSGGSWSEQAKLVPSAPTFGDYFGISVALSGDSLVVGAEYSEIPGEYFPEHVGAAYVFVRSETGWLEQAKLLASTPMLNALFGHSVAIAGDTILVGAPFEPPYDQGAAYVFERGGTTWSEQARLIAPDPYGFEYFGFVSLNAAGDLAFIGAPGHSHDAPNSFTGAGYVFARSGSDWLLLTEILASDGALREQFGRSVANSGETALVGAPQCDQADTQDSGAAYLFSLDAITCRLVSCTSDSECCSGLCRGRPGAKMCRGRSAGFSPKPTVRQIAPR